MKLDISSTDQRQVIDITELIEDNLEGSGVVNIFVQHTTAAIMLADLDPGTDQDILLAIKKMTPTGNWRHPHNPNHFPDHLWSSLIGQSINIPYKQASLSLGSWQRVVLIELDGPRQRSIILSLT